jgi:site-specific DNA recombinase
MTKPRAVLYVRLSVTREASTSIERQKEDLEELARREGWDIVDTIADDGVSGAKDRENARHALRMIRTGEADVLAVWKFDRWSRIGLGAVADLVSALDAREKKDKRPALFVALRDGLRSDQPAWRIIASVLAEVARQERENTRERTRSSIAKLKREGRWSGGTLPLGYASAPNPDGAGRVLVVDESEAEYLREAAERIIAGTSTYAVVMWLNDAAVRPRRAENWTVQAVTQALTGPSIVGRVTVGSDVRRDADGLPTQVYPPAIPLDLWHDVRATIDARRSSSRLVGTRSPSRRSRLLSGIAVCGECGAPLYVRSSSPTTDKNNVRKPGVALYSCSARSNGGACPSVTVTAARLEEHVEALFLAAVGNSEVLRPVEHDSPAIALVEAEAALADVSARLGDPDLNDDEEGRLDAQRRELRSRVRALRSEATAPPEIELVSTGERFRDVWDAAADDIEARRLLLGDALVSVEVRKGRRGTRGLDAARVTPNWRRAQDDYDAPFERDEYRRLTESADE